jgi:hypothetical protein
VSSSFAAVLLSYGAAGLKPANCLDHNQLSMTMTNKSLSPLESSLQVMDRAKSSKEVSARVVLALGVDCEEGREQRDNNDAAAASGTGGTSGAVMKRDQDVVFMGHNNGLVR